MEIGLALSGGGFRATLFHLGVIRRLRAENLLACVRHITSVSGGSIAAAHLWKYWQAYNSTIEEFEGVSKQLLDVTKIDVRGRIQRRMPILWATAVLPRRWRCSPTELLERYYAKSLFGDTCMSDVSDTNRPSLHILSTNLSKAGLECFGHATVTHIPSNAEEAATSVSAQLIPLSLAVAASSAFPGFFPPLEISDEDIGANEGAFPVQFFTDAGVFDNFGLYGLERLSKAVDLMLVSDAGRSFVPTKHHSFGFMRTALRAVDIFMFRIREMELTRVHKTMPGAVIIRIADTASAPTAASPAVQSQLQNIRTDLDVFSEVEVTELIRHGYHVAGAALASHLGNEHESRDEWVPDNGLKSHAPQGASLAKQLREGAARHLGFFRFTDWISWLYAALLLFGSYALWHSAASAFTALRSGIALLSSARLIRYAPPTWRDPMPLVPQVVHDLRRSPNVGFDVLHDDRVWDLRQLSGNRFENGSRKIEGAALMTRISTLRRRGEDGTSYGYWYTTAARSFSARSAKAEFPVKLSRAENPTVSGSAVMNAYELRFDVSNQPLNQPFVLEAQARTTDAPWDRNNSWLGMSFTDDVAESSIRIIFPKDLPFKNQMFSAYPNDSNLQAQVGTKSFDGIVIDGGDGRELIWTVTAPRKDWTYKVQWDWE